MSEKGLTPAERRQKTTRQVDAKIEALRKAMKNRLNDRFHGLPKSITQFGDWLGDEPRKASTQRAGDADEHDEPKSDDVEISEEPNGNLVGIHRQTINSREDLKQEVLQVLAERKSPPEEDIAKKDRRIKELEAQINGLGSANHQLELEVDRLKADLSLRTSRVGQLEARLGKDSSNVTNIRGKG